jgi:putative transposase
MNIYRRKLPHIHLDEKDYTLCYRLANSIPRSVFRKWYQEYEAACLELPPIQSDLWTKKDEQKLSQIKKTLQSNIDKYLDQALHGPTFLKSPEIAKIVIESLHFVESKLRYWTIWSYCIMPNHVHLECTLNEGAPDLEMVLKSHKNFTALNCNKQLQRRGAFWQPETFDRLIRDEQDFNRRVWYTLQNPVKAGLVERWQDWPYTYIHPIIRPDYILGA